MLNPSKYVKRRRVMNGEMYSLIAIAMRYVFAALMALIAIRAIRITIVDSRRAAELRRMSPETGRCGEFVVITGDGRAREGMRYPVIREGLVGSSRKADVRVRSRTVRRSHAFFELTEYGLRVRSNNRAPIYVNGKSRRETLLKDGGHITIGHVELLLVLSVPVMETTDNRDVFDTDETRMNNPDFLFDLRTDIPHAPPAGRAPASNSRPRPVVHEKAPEPAHSDWSPRAADRDRAYAGPFHTPSEPEPQKAAESIFDIPEKEPVIPVKKPAAVDPYAPEPNDEFDAWLNSADDDDWEDTPSVNFDDRWEDAPRKKPASRKPADDDIDDLFHIP